MTITSGATTARNSLEELMRKEWAAEKYEVVADKLHGSIGRFGTRIGCYPNRINPWAKDVNVNEYELAVQFYGAYDLEVNPDETVDPGKIEEDSERFMRGLKQYGGPGTASVWWFQLRDIKFPPDPTGNITRFEAVVVAKGTNPSIIETVG